MSFIIRVLFLFILGFLAADGGDMLGFGQCPYVRAKDSVNRTALAGVWIEQRKYYRWFKNDRCALMLLDSVFINDGNVRMVYGYSTLWRIPWFKNAVLYPVSKVNTTSKFLAYYPFDRNRYEHWWVLDTDYTNFLIVWTCGDTLNLFSERQLMIFTRKWIESEDILDGYKNIAYDRGAPVFSLGKTYIDGCTISV